MALAYSAPVPAAAGLPAHLDVRVLVTRRDDKPLSADDLEALVQVYPPDAEGRGEVEAAITQAKRRAARPKTKPEAPRPSAKAATPKRKAAKKPTRSRAK
jgi:hypothetical protein